jgi:hypothetical protein
MTIEEENRLVDSSQIDAKLSELFDKSLDVNRNEKARFGRGKLGINSKIRLLNQHLGYTVKMLLIKKDDNDR